MRVPSDISTFRAAFWTLKAVRSVKRQLRAGRAYDDLAVPAPRAVSSDGAWAVGAVLRRSQSSCLVQATVRQRWEAAHGRQRDLIIGVTAPADGFRAHAWLEGDPDIDADLVELARRPSV